MSDSPASASVYDVVAVRYGTLETTRAALYAAYEAYGRPDGPMTMDYYFWVLRNDERTVLVDTGFDPEVGIRRGRTPTCAPAEALRRLGVEPAAVDVVVLTHFHYDHIGNVGLFPGARLVVNRRELDFWAGPLGRQPVPAAPVEAAEVEVLLAAQRAGRLTAVPDEPVDLPGIELIELTGHTPGQLAVRVATAGGAVVLASDAAHSYEEFEQDMPFHVFSDLEGMYRSFETLRTWAGTPGSIVVPGHDPDTMRRFPPAGPGLDGLAVRIA
jgi:glyoxylase-like metal-dependent hydrolase (beta-lactamase superfamily II)